MAKSRLAKSINDAGWSQFLSILSVKAAKLATWSTPCGRLRENAGLKVIAVNPNGTEPITTLVLYIRRFFNSVTTLAEHRRELSGEYQCPDFKQFADAIVQVLENLADALQQGQPPRSLPALDPYLEAIHDHIEQLHANRVSELAADLGTATPTLQAIRERTPISTELERDYEYSQCDRPPARMNLRLLLGEFTFL